MAELYMVRHAQASFGTDDYDRLSELGHRQSRWLGDYFVERGLAFDRVIVGTLRRHRETLEGIVAAGTQVVDATLDAGLNEYEAETLLRAHLQGEALPPAPVDGDRRHHFRVLREALAAWTAGTLQCDTHLPFDKFACGVRDALGVACAAGARRVLVVSSGGPISTAIGAVLGAPPDTMVDLNLQMRNTGVSEFAFNSRGAVRCISFNSVPHLDSAERRQWITYS